METSNNMYEWIEPYISDYRTIDGIDMRKRDALKWLNAIGDEAEKWDTDSFSKGELRALKKLGKIATEARIESGYILGSMFLNVSVIRDKVKTSVIDGKEIDLKDFNCDPYDVDYDISPDNIKDILQNPEPAWKICSLSTRRANQAPACPNCDGKGFLKCEECDGSGRRQYVDGNFAGGDDKIKTEQCYNCDGAGKTQCNECAGSGKRQFFSEQYQTVKKFEDIKKITSYAVISSTFDEDAYRYYLLHRDSSIDLPEEEIEKYELKKEIEKWNDFDDEELKDGIVTLYKTQKELIVDKNQTLPDECNGCKGLYKRNKKAAMDYLKKSKEGKLACAAEKHLAVPMFRIHFSTKIDSEEYTVDILEDLDGEKVCNIYSLPDLSFFKSLFV